jgi:PGF-CTERM protein
LGRGLGRTAFVVCCLGVLLAVASGAVAGQEVDISIEPSDVEVAPDEVTTVEVVVDGAGNGVGAHNITVTLADGDVAEITDVTFVKDPLPVQNRAEVTNGGTTAIGVAAMGGNTYSGGNSAVLEVTIRGTTLGESTELTIAESVAVGDESANEYTVDERTGATVSVVENPSSDNSSDGSGPGFGILVALAALAGAGSLRYGLR